MARSPLEHSPGRQGKMAWGRKDEEYIADFCLVSRRALTDFEHRIFRFHFLLGADWRLCTRKLKIDRGNFFHAVYRIEQKLGLVFRELKPYSLFPLQSYFLGAEGNWEEPDPSPARTRQPVRHALHAPLLQTA